MRIQETKPISSPHIRNNHIIDKGWFSRSGFSYNIHVPKLIFLTNSKSDLIPSIVCISKHSQFLSWSILRCRNRSWIRQFSIYCIFKSFYKIHLSRQMKKINHLCKPNRQPLRFWLLFKTSLRQKRCKHWS